MTEKVLELDSLDVPRFPGMENQAEVLAEMRALEKDIGDWRDHIPFEVAVEYYSDSALQKEHSPHVDGCSYCRELLETLHPSERLLQEFQFAVELAVDGALVRAGESKLGTTGKIRRLFGMRVA